MHREHTTLHKRRPTLPRLPTASSFRHTCVIAASDIRVCISEGVPGRSLFFLVVTREDHGGRGYDRERRDEQHDSESECSPNRPPSFPSPPPAAHHSSVPICALPCASADMTGCRGVCGCAWCVSRCPVLGGGFPLSRLGVARLESGVLDDVANLQRLSGAQSCWHV
jgi:hypothetical protein